MQEQDARKTSIEQRGLAVVTTSGTIVTLLFGLVALLTRGDNYSMPTEAVLPLSVALFCFAVAAILGVLANAPLKYLNVDLDEANFWKWWDQSDEDAVQRIAATRLKLFKVAQDRNDWKGQVLIAAVGLEVVAVTSLALTVGFILQR